jgi:hypothetical protein
MGVRGFRNRLWALAAAAAVLGALVGISANPASAEPILSASDVAASIAVPSMTSGSFTAVGTITNSGLLSQNAGSKLIISVSGGAVTSAPAECPISGGVATCTVGAISPGAAINESVTVTPNTGVSTVTTVANVIAANGELNVFPDNSNNSASSVTNLAYNVSLSGVSKPDQVRNGDDALITASVTNNNAAQNITLTVTTDNGYDPALALPAGCAPANGGAKVICTNSYALNQTRSFDIAVKTPTSGATMQTGLSAVGQNGGSASVNVTTNLYSNASAFVPAGKSLTDTERNTTQTFSVPTGSAPGLFLDLHVVDVPSGTMCGTSSCNSYAAEALFPNSGTYSGSDPNHPFLWSINYGRLNCNGAGAPKCTDVLYYIASGQTTPQKLLQCQSYAKATAVLRNVNEVCLQNAVKLGSGSWNFTIALLRDIVIPPIGGVISGSN